MEDYLIEAEERGKDLMEVAASILRSQPLPEKRVFGSFGQDDQEDADEPMDQANDGLEAAADGAVPMSDKDGEQQSLACKIVGNIPARLLISQCTTAVGEAVRGKTKTAARLAPSTKALLDAALIVEERAALAVAAAKWDRVPWIAVSNSDRLSIDQTPETCAGQKCRFVVYPGFAGRHSENEPATATAFTVGGCKIYVCAFHLRSLMAWHGMLRAHKIFPQLLPEKVQEKRSGFFHVLKTGLLELVDDNWVAPAEVHADLEQMLDMDELERGQLAVKHWSDLALVLSMHLNKIRRAHAQSLAPTSLATSSEKSAGKKRARTESSSSSSSAPSKKKKTVTINVDE